MWATEAEEKRKILSFFPCLTPDEFEHGARTVVQGVESGEASQSQDEKSLWRLETSVKDELPYVVVKRPLWSLDEEVQGLETSAHRVNLAGHEEADELNEMHDGEVCFAWPESELAVIELCVDAGFIGKSDQTLRRISGPLPSNIRSPGVVLFPSRFAT